MRADLDSLRAVSARLGANADLIQAGGGNTSIKRDGVLWVKASGKWLIYADREDMFLPVPMHDILTAIDREEEYTTEHGGLRPSVETPMHAVIPHACVIHVHSVNVLAWAARADAPECFAGRLEGLRWEWIPYIHPGLSLALRIQEVMMSSPGVLILQNHGLIVGGADCDDAESRLHDVERRLAIPMRATPPLDKNALTKLAGGEWVRAEEDEVHGLGTDAFCCRTAASGTLYPDHCVYLGHAVARYGEERQEKPPVLLCEGRGVLTSKTLSRAGREMLVCLSRVVRRIPADAPVQYLEHSQVARLVNWDAEHYRQAIAREMQVQDLER